MLRKRVDENGGAPPLRSSKLQVVFGKLSTVLPKASELSGSPKTMATDIIETVMTADSMPPTPTRECSLFRHYDTFSCTDDGSHCLTVPSMSHRLEGELRSAKRSHLSCGEVLLPCGLLQKISHDILSMAESEPYGIRGCLIYLNFEALDECRKLSSVKCDPGTATTFELNLTLKQNSSGWNFIPQFLKNLTLGCSTIVVSPAYILSKKKLYRSILE